MKNSLFIPAAALAAAFALSQQANAVTVFQESVGNDFNNAANWGNGLPGVTDTNAAIQSSLTATTSANYTGTSAYDLNIRSGATLNIGHNLTNVSVYRLATSVGTGTTINHTAGTVTANTFNFGNTSDSALSSVYHLDGGTLSFGNNGGSNSSLLSSALLEVAGGTLQVETVANNQPITGGGRISMTSGTVTTIANDNTDTLFLRTNLTASGGTIDMNGQTYISSGGVLTVEGSGSTQNWTAINSNNGTAGTINMNFDAAGISTIAASSFASLGNLDLLIDGTNYTGSDTSFSIVTSANYTELLNSYSVTGFGTEGVNWELVQTLGTTDGGIVLNIIPEPGSFALLAGLLGLTSVALRRRSA